MTIQAKVPAKKGKTVELINRHATDVGVLYHVRNGEGKQYSVYLRPNGTYECHSTADQQMCMALQHGRKCYHVAACEDAEHPLSFGKHQGKKMAELPVKYIKWLACHPSKLTSEHRHVSMLAKSWQIAEPVAAKSWQIAAPVAEVTPVVADELAVESEPVAPPEVTATRIPVARSTWKPSRPKEDAPGDLYYRPFSLLK